MECLHPYCWVGRGADDWEQVVDHPALKVPPEHRGALLAALNSLGPPARVEELHDLPVSEAVTKRLFDLCPCLFTQSARRVTASAVVHLCEVTLNRRVTESTVYEAFRIQDPNDAVFDFAHPPITPGAKGGDIMEHLCMEVLTNHGLPPMRLDQNGWPIWSSPSHVSLNHGKFSSLKMYGDILIPAAPHNILVSVKTQAARERFLVSGNRLESVGFGFFNQPEEFWSGKRIQLFKRWGFTAIYMPQQTVDAIEERLLHRSQMDLAININGGQLYRPLEVFGRDMLAVAGKTSLSL